MKCWKHTNIDTPQTGCPGSQSSEDLRQLSSISRLHSDFTEWKISLASSNWITDLNLDLTRTELDDCLPPGTLSTDYLDALQNSTEFFSISMWYKYLRIYQNLIVQVISQNIFYTEKSCHNTTNHQCKHFQKYIFKSKSLLGNVIIKYAIFI